MLSKKQRDEYFYELGYGECTEASILKVQKKYFKRKADQDGKYGKNTDMLVVNLYRIKQYECFLFLCDIIWDNYHQGLHFSGSARIIRAKPLSNHRQPPKN